MASETEILRAKISATGAASVTKGIADVRREAEAAARTQRSSTDALNKNTRAAQANSIEANRLAGVTIARTIPSLREARRETDASTAAIIRQTKAVQSAQREHKSFGRGIGAAAIGAAGLAYGARTVYGGVVNAVKSYEANRGAEIGLRYQLGAGGAAKVARDARGFADKNSLDYGDVRKTALGLAGTKKIDADSIVKVLEAFNMLGTLGGAVPEEITRALVQLKQVASNGRLMGDELNLIQEAGIPLRALLQDKGLGGRIGSTDNPIQWSEIQSALLDYGADPKNQQAMADAADRATRSLTELSNAWEYDLKPAVGEVLSPALKEAGSTVAEWTHNLDPGTIQAWTAGILTATPYVLSVGVALKGASLAVNAYRGIVQYKMVGSTLGAAAALDKLTASALAASMTQGGGGVANLVGKGAAGAGVASGSRGVGQLIGPGGVVQRFGHVAAAAVPEAAAGGLGVAGITAGIGLITAGATIAAVEQLSGIGIKDKNSAFYRTAYRLVGGQDEWQMDEGMAKEMEAVNHLRVKIRDFQKVYGLKEAPSLARYYQWSGDAEAGYVLDRRAKRRAEPASPRIASRDAQVAEGMDRVSRKGTRD